MSDSVREAAFLKYQEDVTKQTISGTWEIGNEQRDLNRKCFGMVQDLIPFNDVHKHNDCDLIYRFLIAKRWKVDEAAAGIRDHMKYRVQMKLNEILWEQFPDDLEGLIRFHGIDLENRPVYLWRPDPAFVSVAMQKYPRELIIRHYMKVIEQGRRITLSLGVDRVTCVLDCCNLGIGVLKNVSAIGLLKEISSTIQREYPENLRFMLVLNGGYTFSGMFTILKTILDERVQKKVQNIGSGDKLVEEMKKYMKLENLPKSYGGLGPEVDKPFRALAELPALKPGSPPNFAYGAYKDTPFADQMSAKLGSEGAATFSSPAAAS